MHHFVDNMTSGERVYYESLVKDLYYRLNGVRYPFPSVFSMWKPKSSFGEVHSIAMCILFQFHIFLSDDSDSKKVARIVQRSTGSSFYIRVLTRTDAVDILPGSSLLNRTERQKLSHKR